MWDIKLKKKYSPLKPNKEEKKPSTFNSSTEEHLSSVQQSSFQGKKYVLVIESTLAILPLTPHIPGLPRKSLNPSQNLEGKLLANTIIKLTY